MVVQQVVEWIGPQLGAVGIPDIPNDHAASLEFPIDSSTVGRQDLFEAAGLWFVQFVFCIPGFHEIRHDQALVRCESYWFQGGACGTQTVRCPAPVPGFGSGWSSSPAYPRAEN